MHTGQFYKRTKKTSPPNRIVIPSKESDEDMVGSSNSEMDISIESDSALDSLIALFHTKIDQRNGITASYFTSTTSSLCRHGCFTEEIPEELEYLPKRRCHYATSSYI